jgi:ParB family chromosome partitioning protein
VTSDQSLQEEVWSRVFEHSWLKSSEHIRQELRKDCVPKSEARAKFVGLKSYLKAGGRTDEDLFAAEDDSAVHLVDGDLLTRLALDKLEKTAAKLRSEGWSWIEVALHRDYTQEARLIRIYPQRDQRSAVEDPEQEEKQFSEEKFDVRSTAVWTQERKAVGGGFVTLGWNGRTHVELGFVRRQDKSKLAELRLAQGGEGETSTDLPGEDDDISAVLAEELSTEKTLALRAVVAHSPHVALATIVNHLLSELRCDESFQSLLCESSLSIRAEHQRLIDHQDEEKREDTRAVQSYETRVKDVLTDLPSDPGELWQYLMQAETERLLKLLAVAAARLIYAVRKPHAVDPAQLRAAERLAMSCGLNMTEWWKPTVSNYLGRVSKAKIVEALKEAGKELEIAGKKKADLARDAEQVLQTTNWLPALLRVR